VDANIYLLWMSFLMEDWNDLWFRCQVLPASGFPKKMIGPAQVIAEEWLFEDSFRCILTEWVSGSRADRDLGGLLWSGFRLRGQQDRRVAPIPVLVQILFSEPFPTNTTELEDRMRQSDE
jgi:hypothetical protein